MEQATWTPWSGLTRFGPHSVSPLSTCLYPARSLQAALPAPLLTVVTPSHLHLGVGPAVRGQRSESETPSAVPMAGQDPWRGCWCPGVGALMSVSTLLSPGGPGVAERRAMGGLSARLWAPALWKYLRVRGGQPEGPVSGACGHCGWGLKGN